MSLFNSIPRCKTNETTATTDEKWDELISVYPTGYDEKNGQGDICRYISAKNWVKGKWRMPTMDEFQNLWESGTKGLSNADYYGLRYPSYDYVFELQTITQTDGMESIIYGYYIGPSVTGISVSGATRTTVSFPASGFRMGYDTGSPLHLSGENASYWTSSPYSAGL